MTQLPNAFKTTARSQALFHKAQKFFPGGVNSPVRAFQGVGGNPLFIHKSQGAYLWDEDGNRYIDYLLSWGPMILGHADKDIVHAVQQAAREGLSFGTPTIRENQLAELIQYFYPCAEKMRFVSSGTEAAMSAIRLARGFTRRNKIIKFDGCYHGHADAFLVSAGSGNLTLGISDSAGVPEDISKNTVSIPWNDLTTLKEVFHRNKKQIAAVILEPVCGNMGLVLPEAGFLEGVRALCSKHGTLLIFDEVLCGFRVHPQGAAALYGVTPDLLCLGKVLGGGLPVGAYAGKKEILDCMAPLGNVYQAGTLSGNPLTMAAGIATLQKLKTTDAFPRAAKACEALASGIRDNLKKLNLPFQILHQGTLFTLAFTSQKIRDFVSVKTSQIPLFKRYFHAMLKRGIFLAPSAFEVGFTSSAHENKDIEKTLRANFEALKWRG
jgi:glutamate-1-semialdehyde 2,1-aminomutase